MADCIPITFLQLTTFHQRFKIALYSGPLISIKSRISKEHETNWNARLIFPKRFQMLIQITTIPCQAFWGVVFKYTKLKKKLSLLHSRQRGSNWVYLLCMRFCELKFSFITVDFWIVITRVIAFVIKDMSISDNKANQILIMIKHNWFFLLQPNSMTLRKAYC